MTNIGQANPIAAPAETTVREDVAQGLNEYGTVLRNSSDRSRYAIYVVTIVTILIGIANYNIQENSWARRRLIKWYQYARSSSGLPQPPAEIANGDSEMLQALRSEYVKQFVGRDVVAASPIPGVSIDINDLGLVGGIALVLLMQVVLVCVAREHENVYLSLYKVRLIAQREGPTSAHGNSQSNLLYHSMAMGQVLSAPPTLARWVHHGPWHHFRLVFAAPAIVYAWVVYNDYRTVSHGVLYGVNVKVLLAIETLLALFLLAQCTLANLQSRAMALRWESAFFTVNPHRRNMPQMTLWQWLALGPIPTGTSSPEKRTISAIVDAPYVAVNSVGTVRVTPKPPISCPRNEVTRAILQAMAAALVNEGVDRAKDDCSRQGHKFLRLSRLTNIRSEFRNGDWAVEGDWEFEYE